MPQARRKKESSRSRIPDVVGRENSPVFKATLLPRLWLGRKKAGKTAAGLNILAPALKQKFAISASVLEHHCLRNGKGAFENVEHSIPPEGF